MPHPLDGRIPEARHVEMLRLRLVEKLTLREVGRRTGVAGTTVQQLLNHYFDVPGIRDSKDAPADAKVPAGFVVILQSIVAQEREKGRAVIVNILRKRRAAEWKRLGESKGAERRAVWVNLKRIGAFLASVGHED
jgi:hypothetical protein